MLSDGWEVAPSPPGACAGPAELDGLSWRAARVPGTVAGALGEDAAGRDLDADDWWFRCHFDAEPAADAEEVVLGLGGLATVAEVYLNGQLVLESESMFAAHAVDVSRRLRGANELVICCRALAPRLAQPRKPRARWRTRLVSNGNLRFFRTMLLGRAPGFAPGPAVVGPWRPVSLERRRGCVLDSVRLRTRLDDDGTGRLACRVAARAVAGTALPTGARVERGRSRRDDRRRRSADRRRRYLADADPRRSVVAPHPRRARAPRRGRAGRRRAVAPRSCRLPPPADARRPRRGWPEPARQRRAGVRARGGVDAARPPRSPRGRGTSCGRCSSGSSPRA